MRFNEDRAINNSRVNMNPRPQVDYDDEFRTMSHSESIPIVQAIKPMNQRMEEQKEYIRSQMGSEVYEKVLKILQLHKRNDSDSTDVQESLKLMTGKNKKMKDLCFSLEMLVWKEQ